MSPPLAIQWPFKGFDQERQRLLAQAREKMYLYADPDITAVGEIHATTAFGFDVLMSGEAWPHNDPTFEKWSALWVLHASEGHVLGIANHLPPQISDYAKPLQRPTHAPGLMQFQMETGSLILMNIHCTHWVDMAKDKSNLLVASISFDRHPSQKKVETTYRELIRSQLRAC